ncbi:1,4-dihydroxy-2-naphthoyl-CoA hydrolase in phylloquinone biosynthesis [Alloactinosynnema sp. L-07]|uniref:acyl-CoA thioesterase n=1 Tax=Alloactinosynnema sp. L-07 TaxID=1653480 RepID=UPI00065EF7AA|nr:thioesterase family protein [Alloactinosynnema sp. L-07]CRK55351.1 1,4-dihydroxy-2-naphthoyl-CoA hydrolase in phylloquinone biosynthesis [Alloactinosynnema sp. L-07]
MGVFVSEVRPRWSDMDAYGHVNHANTVTLLEEARVDLLFNEAKLRGVIDLAQGVVIAKLSVEYHLPLFATGGAVRIAVSVREIRGAYFILDYTVHNGTKESDPVAVTATTTLAPYDLVNSKPRRITDSERDFLAAWHNGGNGGVLRA